LNSQQYDFNQSKQSILKMKELKFSEKKIPMKIFDISFQKKEKEFLSKETCPKFSAKPNLPSF